MAMRQLYYLLVSMMCMAALPSVAQNESGFLVGGGNGSYSVNYPVKSIYWESGKDYKFNLSLAYQYGIITSSSIFFDMSANLGVKQWCLSYLESMWLDIRAVLPDGRLHVTSNCYCLSLDGTANYILYKGLGVVASVEPTCYFKCTKVEDVRHFDIPLVGKIACRFMTSEVG